MTWLTDNIQLLTTLAALLSSPITWFVTKRHFTRQEIDKNNSDLLSSNITIYQRMLDDIETRYEEKLVKRDKEIELLERDIENLRERIKELERNFERE